MEKEEWKNCLSMLRGGSIEAFETLYEELKTPAYTLILRITRNTETAEDVLQEYFLRLFRQPPPEDVKNPKAYLLGGARNAAIDALRKREAGISLEDAPEIAEETDLALRTDVETALRRLDGTDCQIVTMHLNAGLTFRETAEIIRMPLGTVLWRYKRALKALRKELGGIT